MSTILDPPRPRGEATSPSTRLQTTMAASRLSITWFGVRRSLTPAQRSQAAESFGAEEDFLSAGKKLLDVRHPAFRAVTAVKNRAVGFWRGISLPYPEPGLRLVRHVDLDSFDGRMGEYLSELIRAAEALDAHYDELKAAARERLGSLYSAADYPPALAPLFDLTWDFPSVEPPDYLRQLNPALYAQQCERVAARFDEAVQLAEAAFMEELEKLVAHLAERLSGREDGKPKVFRDSAIDNLNEFFARFRRLNIRSSEELDALVRHCQEVVQGASPQSLREQAVLRQTLAQELAEVQTALEGLLVDRPRRNILRRAK